MILRIKLDEDKGALLLYNLGSNPYQVEQIEGGERGDAGYGSTGR